MENTDANKINDTVKQPEQSYHSDIDKHNIGEDNFFTRTAGQTELTQIAKGESSDPRIRTRPGFSREDLYTAREEERKPTDHANEIRICQNIYRRNGLIRNIIDLMADFASDGLDILHPNNYQEKFYQSWMKKTDLQHRVNLFMKLILRDGNTIIYRKFAKVSKPTLRKMTSGAKINKKDLIKVEKDIEAQKKQIPWKYNFISPTMARKLDGPLGKLCGTDRIGVVLDAKIVSSIRQPKNDYERELIKLLPSEVLEAAKQVQTNKTTITNTGVVVPLDPFKSYVSYYKKDDWDDWATPFLVGIIDDILFKEKMRQADNAALDGIINVTRLWKLGKAESKIYPTPALANKLLSILENNVGGGVMDIVWDDMIDLQVEYPPIDKILGEQKYKSVNQDIVRGLGIPDALVGGSDSTTRNSQTAFVQLKTLMQRLQYIRELATNWLNHELALVAKAMGFKKPPLVSFNITSLQDEATEKKLLIQLLDRNIIGAETVLNTFGRDFMIELERMKNENEIRTDDAELLEKANPYYRPKTLMQMQFDQEIKLAELNAKNAQMGGENPNGDQPRSIEKNKPAGRPPGTKDGEPRSPKIMSFIYKSMANRFLIQLDEMMDKKFTSGNKRQLTKIKKDELEAMKWHLLCVLKPNDTVNEDFIKSIDIAQSKKIAIALNIIYTNMCSKFMSLVSQELTLNDKRDLMTSTWAYYYAEK